MKKKGFNSNTNGNENENNGVSEIPKQKERHIVSWSQEEDDILREQIQIHGTENWTIIASKFEDKTTRQCRRRWYTYLNSDFKKGGWSPEEDQLLCEAQKIFGNRWTEIAKVVSGRTDNAVKNRFSTLCKKRAKHEALAKENNNSFININNKRIIFTMEGVSNKKMRIETGEKSIVEYGNINELVRSPFTVLAQNFKQIEDAASEDSSEYSSGSATTDKEKGLGGVADVEYNSPIQVTPIFTSLAEAVPTPNFSESERHFLLKTLGLESASTAPPCKRVLLNSL